MPTRISGGALHKDDTWRGVPMKKDGRFADDYTDSVALGIGWAMLRLEHLAYFREADQPMITEVRVKLPEMAAGDTLVVVKGIVGDQRVICFHSAHGPGEAVRGAIERVRNGQAGWKDDQFGVPANKVT